MDCALLPKNRFFSNLQILIVDAGNKIVDTLTGPKAQIRIFVGKNVNRQVWLPNNRHPAPLRILTAEFF